MVSRAVGEEGWINVHGAEVVTVDGVGYVCGGVGWLSGGWFDDHIPVGWSMGG